MHSGANDVDYIIGGLKTVFLFAYLIYALRKPEKFRLYRGTYDTQWFTADCSLLFNNSCRGEADGGVHGEAF